MKMRLLLALVFTGFIGLMLIGSAIPIQLAYSSSAEESSGENQQDGSAQDQATDGESDTQPEPSTKPSEDEISTEQLGENADQEEQEQRALEIIEDNGLVVVNETLTNTGGGSSAAKCVANSQGQTFCYEPLPTEENCLKPIKVEDPPLCGKA